MPYLPKAQRRAQIIDAAVALMTAQGLAAATVRAVAGEIGTAPGQIHHHFASADALRAEAFRAFGRQLTTEFDSELGHLSGMDRILAMIDPRPRPREAHVERLMQEAVMAARLDPLIREAVADVMEMWQDRITATLREMLAARGCGDEAACCISRRLVAIHIGADVLRDYGVEAVFDDAALRRHVELELGAVAPAAD